MGRKHGPGVFAMGDGSRYEGEFVDGEIEVLPYLSGARVAWSDPELLNQRGATDLPGESVLTTARAYEKDAHDRLRF